MTGSRAETAGADAALRALPGDVGLDRRAAEVFESRCRVARGRYDTWRRNFGALDAFMETDADRGKAIAGNLATEAQAVMMTWVRAWVEANDGRLGKERARDLRGRLEEFVPRWRSAAARVGREYYRSNEGRRVFEAVLDDLLERGLERADESIAAASGNVRNPVLQGGLAALARAGSVAATLWQRMFDPEG